MDQVDHKTVWVRHEVTPDFWSLFLSRLPHCSPGAALISLHLPPSLSLSPAAWSFPRGKTWRLNSLQLSSIPSLSPSLSLAVAAAEMAFLRLLLPLALYLALSLSPCRNLGGRRRRATFGTDGRPRPREGRRDGAGNGTGRSWNHAILALWSRRTDGRSRKNQELSWSTMKVEL